VGGLQPYNQPQTVKQKIKWRQLVKGIKAKWYKTRPLCVQKCPFTESYNLAWSLYNYVTTDRLNKTLATYSHYTASQVWSNYIAPNSLHFIRLSFWVLFNSFLERAKTCRMLVPEIEICPFKLMVTFHVSAWLFSNFTQNLMLTWCSALRFPMEQWTMLHKAHPYKQECHTIWSECTGLWRGVKFDWRQYEIINQDFGKRILRLALAWSCLTMNKRGVRAGNSSKK